MAGVKGTKHLTEEEFNNIKSLKNAGISNSMIAKVIKRSNHIINEIGKIETFDEFREFQRARREEYRTRKEAENHIEVQPLPSSSLFLQESEAFNIPKEDRVPEVDKDSQKLLNRLDNIQLALNRLVELEEARQGVEKHNAWRFGRSR
jgi:hypothetical protein